MVEAWAIWEKGIGRYRLPVWNKSQEKRDRIRKIVNDTVVAFVW